MLPFYLRSLPDGVYPSDVILSAQVGETQGLSPVLEQNPVNITFNLVCTVHCTLQPCRHTLHTHACSTHMHHTHMHPHTTHAHTHTYAPTHYTCTHTHIHTGTHTCVHTQICLLKLTEDVPGDSPKLCLL